MDKSHADSWGSPSLRSTVSPDSSIIVRLHPGEGHVDYPDNKSNEPRAIAKYYRWVEPHGYEFYQSVNLVNAAAPIDSLVMNDGSFITIDNWYSTGSGSVVVLYSPMGNIIKSYKLRELFPKKEDYQRLGRSVSSIQWRCSLPSFRQASVFIPHVLGGHFYLNTNTGEIKNIDTGKQCE